MINSFLRLQHDYTHSRKRHLYRPLHRLGKQISNFRLQKHFEQEVPKHSNEIRMFVVMRNEEYRLEEFLNYHIELGVDRIFIVDNDSNDKSITIAKKYPQVHLFSTKESYIAHMNWVELLIEEYGNDHWCLLLDVDELLAYPEMHSLSLKELCCFLSKNNCEGLRCLMLDMYGKEAIKDTQYQSNKSLFEACPYFDAEYSQHESWFLDREEWTMVPTSTFLGGPRQRVMGVPSWIGKVPLFHYKIGMSISRGCHDIHRVKIASQLQGVLFHFKFLNDFVKRANLEKKRKQHYDAAREYQVYSSALKQDPQLSFHHDKSQRFESIDQLEELNCIKSCEELKLLSNSNT